MVVHPGSVAVFLLLAVHVAVGGALVNFCDTNHPSDPHGSCRNRKGRLGEARRNSAVICPMGTKEGSFVNLKHQLRAG